METFDIVNLAITIGLGILSLGLGIFSIWLSLKFNDKSNEALNSVKDLSNELKSLMDVSLTHQKDFSSKMLDSILDKNQYGVSSDEVQQDQSLTVVENILNTKLAETEMHLSEMVEKKIKSLSSQNLPNDVAIEKAIRDIKNEIQTISKTVVDVSSSFKLPKALRGKMLKWKEYPAHYVVLACIIKENVTSLEELENYKSDYHLPGNYETGLQNLIDSEIIDGSLNKFTILDEDKAHLSVWVERNWLLLKKFINHYSSKEENIVTEYEASLAEEFVF